LVGVAKLNRRRLTGTTFIGVTGSCGKSTTIALADGILSSAGKCITVTGRSVTNAMDAVLRSNAATKFCMVETHGSFPGAIALSVAALRPQIGVVTTIGGDHYSNYRSLEATAQEKGRLVESLPPGGVAVLNIDDPHVAGMTKRTKAHLLTFGRSAEADLRASEVVSVWPGRLSLKAVYRGESVLVETKLLGEHWVTATLAGIGIGLACGLDLKTCAEVVGTVDPVFGRYTVHVRPDGAAYVLDSHKAPYWTIGEGLAFVKGVHAPRKTIVFGTISDYPGAASPRYRRIARAALEVADRVIVVGRHAGHIDKLRQGAVKDRLFGFETTYQVSAFLNGDQMADELIYVKASITQHLERIMLSCLDEVVCWHERCGRKRPCIDCRHYRTPRRPPFGVVAAETAGHEPAAVETRASL
jgi:UDP-N-acetylmuramoyl-tripeptide--D-alanyl-D-alanine ligase